MLFIRTLIQWFDHEIGVDKIGSNFDTIDLNLETGDFD